MTPNSPATTIYTDETRFALMEQSMRHMSESLHRLELNMENSFNKIDARFEKVDQRFEKVEKDILEVQKELKGEIRSNFFWTLGLIGSLFAVTAHGLHWF